MMLSWGSRKGWKRQPHMPVIRCQAGAWQPLSMAMLVVHFLDEMLFTLALARMHRGVERLTMIGRVVAPFDRKQLTLAPIALVLLPYEDRSWHHVDRRLLDDCRGADIDIDSCCDGRRRHSYQKDTHQKSHCNAHIFFHFVHPLNAYLINGWLTAPARQQRSGGGGRPAGPAGGCLM